jgi:GTPase
MEKNFIEKVILVHISEEGKPNDLVEFKDLAKSTGANILAIIEANVRITPTAKYFIGSGKAEEIQRIVLATNADLAIFSHDLSPAQERNLESLLKCRVIDRTGLILDIFARRARTFEGRLQVELAQLQHLSTRLVRGWTHLERQKGGIGLKGPGETQLEVDRRLIKSRIKAIKERLIKVRQQREQGRKSRRKAEIPTVSLVGYTNAGKSTLFNKLAAENVYVADQLFATLDPTLRFIELPDVGKVILIDTVGFISNLPHDLVEAFRATLEETVNADLLLHVIDASDPEKTAKIAAVDAVLAQIGAEQVLQLLVYNKIDLTTHNEPQLYKEPPKVRISALQEKGLNLLLQNINDLLATDVKMHKLILAATEGKLHAKLYEIGNVIAEKTLDNGGWEIKVRLRDRDFRRIKKCKP